MQKAGRAVDVLPDRRDLNRSFPGSAKGSIAARLAGLFLREIVAKADVEIDLHTGALHRSNLAKASNAGESLGSGRTASKVS
jgi:predicted deacylase